MQTTIHPHSVTMPNFYKVTSPADISCVARLAHKIWTAHYPAIIGQQQVEYMLENFQSESAIHKQISSSTLYYLVKNIDQSVGYFSMAPAISGSIKISKLYILPEQQRSKIGSKIIAFIEAYCLQHSINNLWLTVNRDNLHAIQFYKKLGFITESCVILDIGNGFIMDDYKMVKNLNDK